MATEEHPPRPIDRPDYPRSPGLRHLHDRYIGQDPERIASYSRALAEGRREIGRAPADRRL